VADPAMVAPVTRAMLDGEPIAWHADATWPLPPLPPNVVTAPDTRHAVVVTDRVVHVKETAVLVLHPPSLVLGIGASRGVGEAELAELVDRVLGEAGLAASSVRCIATADIKADEAGLVAFARARGWTLETYPASALSQVDVPHPSEVVARAVGTPSVSEAAALLSARSHGRDAELVVPKTASTMATVAMARLTPRGRLTIIGLGPGAGDLRTPRATARLRSASIVVGLDQYVDQIKPLLSHGVRIVASGLGAEEERARAAVLLAREGHAVALIGSGDAGIYAMASPALEFAGDDIDVEVVPGVTAAIAAASLLGAPLGPRPRLHLAVRPAHAVGGDRAPARIGGPGRPRRVPLQSAQRPPHRAAARGAADPRQAPSTHDTRGRGTGGVPRGRTRAAHDLAEVNPEDVDMSTLVIVGASTTRNVNGRMVTPRGYQWMPE
jgi:cobalt-precorrin 5A hydrolase/precorrin-3B C17-methyltransferase